jgi:hypothetical protein
MPGIRLLRITSSFVAELTRLPAKPPVDPADRLIIATSRVHGFVLVAADQLILRWPTLGHVGTTPAV